MQNREERSTTPDRLIVYAALAFLAIALLSLTIMGISVYFIGQELVRSDAKDMDAKSTLLLAPFFLFIIATTSSFVGYGLLRRAGAGSKPVIPIQDALVIDALLLKSADGIGDYIRLSSLTGVMGYFVKIGLSGLPLATILLSIFFALLAYRKDMNKEFLDLARLTLGAFIGSFVQRHITDPQLMKTPVLAAGVLDSKAAKMQADAATTQATAAGIQKEAAVIQKEAADDEAQNH